jgi:hypothetical protein
MNGSDLDTRSFKAPIAARVQETFDSWPSSYTPMAFQVTSGSVASPADFTGSDGLSGQPYVLLGGPAAVAPAAVAPATGGVIAPGSTIGGRGSAADPGAADAAAGDPVNTENGDFSQSSTDLSIPTFGPSLDFSRTYDAQLAQQETQTGSPGPLGCGWTDDWASSLSLASPTPADTYTMDGLAVDTGDGGVPRSAVLNAPGGVTYYGGNVYIADSAGNRIQEISGATGTQWGQSMTAGDVYTIAGAATGTSGASPNGHPMGTARLHDPGSVAFDSAGDLYIADSGNNRVLEVPASSGGGMTADDIYTVAGDAGAGYGTSGDGGAATSAFLHDPIGLASGGRLDSAVLSCNTEPI